MSVLEPGVEGLKRPRLRIISPQSLDEVRAARPDFVISTAVLKHAPECELANYFDNLCALANETTTLAITFLRIRDRKTHFGQIVGMVSTTYSADDRRTPATSHHKGHLETKVETKKQSFAKQLCYGCTSC